ncbi:hypothetical protein YC2023_079554 [Brassica napus]
MVDRATTSVVVYQLRRYHRKRPRRRDDEDKLKKTNPSSYPTNVALRALSTPELGVMGSSPPPVDPALQSPAKTYSQAATQSSRAKEKENDPAGYGMESNLANSAKETEVSKSIDTSEGVQEVEKVDKTETTTEKEHTEEDGNISVLDKEARNNVVSENEEPWLTVQQSSPSGSGKLSKPGTNKVPEDQSNTSPSRFHLLRKELEEGEMEDEEESTSSDGESSVEIKETFERRKQLEKEKSARNKKN